MEEVLSDPMVAEVMDIIIVVVIIEEEVIMEIEAIGIEARDRTIQEEYTTSMYFLRYTLCIYAHTYTCALWYVQRNHLYLGKTIFRSSCCSVVAMAPSWWWWFTAGKRSKWMDLLARCNILKYATMPHFYVP